MRDLIATPCDFDKKLPAIIQETAKKQPHQSTENITVWVGYQLLIGSAGLTACTETMHSLGLSHLKASEQVETLHPAPQGLLHWASKTFAFDASQTKNPLRQQWHRDLADFCGKLANFIEKTADDFKVIHELQLKEVSEFQLKTHCLRNAIETFHHHCKTQLLFLSPNVNLLASLVDHTLRLLVNREIYTLFEGQQPHQFIPIKKHPDTLSSSPHFFKTESSFNQPSGDGQKNTFKPSRN